MSDTKWISVDAQLPKRFEDVVVAVWRNSKWMYDTTWLNSSGEWVSPITVNAEVKFWMPLPEPPQTGGAA